MEREIAVAQPQVEKDVFMKETKFFFSSLLHTPTSLFPSFSLVTFSSGEMEIAEHSEPSPPHPWALYRRTCV